MRHVAFLITSKILKKDFLQKLEKLGKFKKNLGNFFFSLVILS